MLHPDEIVDQRYRIEHQLGQGGMGTVFRAHDEVLRRPTAIKTLSPGQTDAKYRDRLFEEATSLARLQHPNVAGVYTASFHAGVPYVAMELVAGPNLGELIFEHVRAEEHVPLARAFSILAGMARGLAAVHGAGLVHRDVKPENVIIERGTGRVVLVDFGLAAKAQTERSATVIGTPAYMAPELCNPPIRAPRPAADIYSLGCVATELLTLAPPFEGDNPVTMFEAHARSPRPDLVGRRPDLRGYDATLARCLAVEPQGRPPSAAAVADEFDELANTLHLAALRHAVLSPHDVISEPGEPVFAAVRVLVIDDDPISSRIAARCVQVAFAGIPVEISRRSTAAAALESALKRQPDLILLDYLLPDANGFELLSQLRHRELATHAHVVVITGNMDAVEKWRFQILGVADFVEKPIQLERLAPMIHGVASRRGWLPASSDSATQP